MVCVHDRKSRIFGIGGLHAVHCLYSVLLECVGKMNFIKVFKMRNGPTNGAEKKVTRVESYKKSASDRTFNDEGWGVN